MVFGTTWRHTQTHTHTPKKKKKKGYACASVPMCTLFTACNGGDTVNASSLRPAGCWGVSRVGEDGNILIHRRKTEQTFAVHCLYNPYLPLAGPAPWKRALPMMLMPQHRVGRLMLSGSF